ncbi:hypothetical protein [Serratia aquatilis]|uniref:Uncharacterized protein n=1 Tax=Serratia aquatilis TaxID=1737515 RepID=A0ABV6EJF1_9GAMM
MDADVNLISKDNAGVFWEFNKRRIHIPFEPDGTAIYSKKYKIIVVMNIKPGDYSLNMKAYDLNGELKASILPYNKDELSYGYMSTSDRVDSGIVVVAGYKNRKDEFYDWQFEVDLKEFKISNCIDRAY